MCIRVHQLYHKRVSAGGQGMETHSHPRLWCIGGMNTQVSGGDWLADRISKGCCHTQVPVASPLDKAVVSWAFSVVKQVACKKRHCDRWAHSL